MTPKESEGTRMNREELLRALEEVDWSGLDRHNADIAEDRA